MSESTTSDNLRTSRPLESNEDKLEADFYSVYEESVRPDTATNGLQPSQTSEDKVVGASGHEEVEPGVEVTKHDSAKSSLIANQPMQALEADPEIDTGLKTETKADPEIDSKIVSTIDPEVETEADPSADPSADPLTDSSADPIADSRVDPTADLKSDPTTDTTGSKSDPTTKSKIDPITDTTDAKIDPTTNYKTIPITSSKIDPTADSEEEADSDVSLSAYGEQSEENAALEPAPGSPPVSIAKLEAADSPNEIEQHTAHAPLHANLQDGPPPLPSRDLKGKLKSTTPQPTPVHAVPPPLAEELKSESFRKSIAALNVNSKTPPPVPPRTSHNRSVSADFDLVISRFQDNEDEYMSKDDVTQENLQEGARVLKSSYTAFLETIGPSKEVHETTQDDEDDRELMTVDWPFWTRLVSNYAEVAKKDSVKLEQEIARGIPPQVRGIIWQLLSSSKSKEIDDEYARLKDLESPHEKAIERDLSRTSFIPKEKVMSLFQVLKAYSLHDPDVGYTQGMAFVATALLLNVETDSEAFGLLISLMKGYGLRELFLPNMPGLHIKLHQFDRLIEENSPSLYNHLARQGVRSSMYASQWFLTCFAYRFPLCFVLRILDVVFVEGLEAILKFALVLMIKNEKTLITLQFDQLLEFLKNGLFAHYLKSSEVSRDDSRSTFPLMYKTPSLENDGSGTSQGSNEAYAVDVFVKDAMHEVKITPISLRRYIAEYEEIHLLESQKEAQMDSLRIKNKQLHNEVRKLERDHTVLNREHINIANELIENRLALETLQDQNRDLQSEVQQLKVQLQDEIRKQSLPNPDSQIPTDIRADLKETMARNLEVMSANQELQERTVELERELLNAKRQISKENRNPANWKTLRKVWK
ncbi:LAME_0B05688g1_1 [Lachancea meyersii CBS 8951]|uniref:GTPase-activating protein GYP5 n=1 Tax=Lachancea meyersii CBS 8951 TaxID=1266667 RepID=A0A1G4IW98_9SACH|nr:LAME_0B05688g1_1 [Lachancea meyersii CBS 8951]